MLDPTDTFCRRLGLRLPMLLAPMAGVCPPGLSVAVANAGGPRVCGGLLMQPAEIRYWADEVRAGSSGASQMNTMIPDPFGMDPTGCGLEAEIPEIGDFRTTTLGERPVLIRPAWSKIVAPIAA